MLRKATRLFKSYCSFNKKWNRIGRSNGSYSTNFSNSSQQKTTPRNLHLIPLKTSLQFLKHLQLQKILLLLVRETIQIKQCNHLPRDSPTTKVRTMFLSVQMMKQWKTSVKYTKVALILARLEDLKIKLCRTTSTNQRAVDSLPLTISVFINCSTERKFLKNLWRCVSQA